MRAGVSCAAARPAPAQMRGQTWLLMAPRRVAAASRVALGAARCAPPGCAVGLVAAAPEAEPPRRRGRPRKTADSEAEQAEPPARERRGRNAGERVAGEPPQAVPLRHMRTLAPMVGKRGEKTEDGKPQPDERTVADLVRRGWFVSSQAAVALLTRAESRKERFAFETAEPAADWLEATLGPEPVKDGLCPAARAVKREPPLLTKDAVTLQRKWDALTWSTEQGGVGIAFSTEQAREAVRKYPQLLGFSVDTYKTGWSMLTESGLCQTVGEARECILRSPRVLSHDSDDVVVRLALLVSLGYADAFEMVLKQPRVLNYKEETVKEHAAWWQQTGLDHVKLVTTQPTLLGGVSVKELQAKLDFLSHVAGMSKEGLNNAPSLFALSLDGRLRTRYFYALQKHRLTQFTSTHTMMKVTDAAFLAMVQGGTTRDRTSEAEVARYRKLVTSAKFAAWRERQEAHILRRRP